MKTPIIFLFALLIALVFFELFYQGGVTTVELIQQGKDMRVIETYSAD